MLLSCTGKMPTGGGNNYQVIVWEVNMDKRLYLLRRHLDWVLFNASAPDGRLLAGGMPEALGAIEA